MLTSTQTYYNIILFENNLERKGYYMDFMYIIIQWLKGFIDKMGRIASFIGDSFLPDVDF